MQRRFSFLIICISINLGLDFFHQVNVSSLCRIMHHVVHVIVYIHNRYVFLSQQQVYSFQLTFANSNHQRRLTSGILCIVIGMGSKQFAHHLNIVVLCCKMHQCIALFKGIIDTGALRHQELDSIHITALHSISKCGIALTILGINMSSFSNITFHFILVSRYSDSDKQGISIHAVRYKLFHIS